MSEHKDFKRVDVRTSEGLEHVAELLHDEYLDVRQISYDSQQGLLEIHFKRIFHEGPRKVIKNRLIYRIEEVEILRGYLRFKGVVDFELRDREQIETYSFDDFQFDPSQGVLTIYCCPNCKLLLHVREIDAEYREVEYRGKARITQGWWWDSVPGAPGEE